MHAYTNTCGARAARAYADRPRHSESIYLGVLVCKCVHAQLVALRSTHTHTHTHTHTSQATFHHSLVPMDNISEHTRTWSTYAGALQAWSTCSTHQSKSSTHQSTKHIFVFVCAWWCACVRITQWCKSSKPSYSCDASSENVAFVYVWVYMNLWSGSSNPRHHHIWLENMSSFACMCRYECECSVHMHVGLHNCICVRDRTWMPCAIHLT